MKALRRQDSLTSEQVGDISYDAGSEDSGSAGSGDEMIEESSRKDTSYPSIQSEHRGSPIEQPSRKGSGKKMLFYSQNKQGEVTVTVNDTSLCFSDRKSPSEETITENDSELDRSQEGAGFSRHGAPRPGKVFKEQEVQNFEESSATQK
mmetsp:Transcript_41999/g.55331  ORF Transcript_41999/g.55331 Transcript_41999/m.55331 type:complete len:149 (-) Transcript_41999:536-982(-)|eukprot:CAMPEP_0185584066 /NCGR_PEP_ID=MMETSP0434-20130131/29934_1 /TAXON_ID=626734 ORGANISM="Favella taraikaensis, Strain Fe Narragansett Bay" /NCGR_SAMPLE_ID=MMETSP0434 /ASSEMBLY_ACC=CAM_ASM_000379 /LENGTH=148 /DNA_ID=CAMNT_0028203595 /DNA_START=165 /DNA_END=614 /DNA_ORIENTATION=-